MAEENKKGGKLGFVALVAAGVVVAHFGLMAVTGAYNWVKTKATAGK